jgi:hypothetical protein
MAQLRANQNAQLMNQQMQMQMQLMNLRGVKSSDIEYDFEVIMKDSTKKQVTSAIYSDSTKKHFIVYVDKKYKKSDKNRYKIIYPSETLTIICVLEAQNEYYNTPGHYVRSIPTDSCWMFKVISGRINLYSSMVNSVTESNAVGIQVNDGPIIPFNENNLKTIIANDEDAMKRFENKKYIKAVKKYNDDVEKAAQSSQVKNH